MPPGYVLYPVAHTEGIFVPKLTDSGKGFYCRFHLLANGDDAVSVTVRRSSPGASRIVHLIIINKSNRIKFVL